MNISYFLEAIKFYIDCILYGRFRVHTIKMFLKRITGNSKPVTKPLYLLYQRQTKSHMIVDSSRLNFYISKFEPTVINTVKRLVKENTLFIDVGAYVGFYTIFCAKHGAKVIALEPDPRSYKILLYNVRLAKVSQKVFALNTAAGDKCGHALLRLSSNPSESSMTSYLKPELVIRKIRCRCVTLDDLINEFGWDKVDLIKIDVEGAGFKVIRGALNSIAKHKPKIILETHKIPSKENELAAVKFLKKNYNYKYKILEYRNKQNFILFLYTDS